MTGPRSAVASLALALALSAAPRPAQAEASEADAAFARGTKAYQTGDNRGAAEAFETAYRLEPHGVAKYSAALAWEASGELPRAADDYALSLASGQLDATQKLDAERRLHTLAKQLGRVEVSAPSGSRIQLAHVDGAAAPATIYVLPGEHALEARFSDGTKRRARVSVRAGESAKVTLEPEPEKPAEPQSGGALPPATSAPAEPPASSSQKTLGWVFVGGAGIASITAVVLGSRALAARNEFNDSGWRDASAHDRAASLRTATNVTWGVAGVFAVTGGVLLFTAPKRSETRGVDVGVGPFGAWLNGRF